MKRLFPLFLILCLLLTGCDFMNRGADLSSNCKKIGLSILEVTDDYLDGNITPIVAAGQIQDLCRQLSTVPDETGSKNQMVKNYCEVLGYTLTRVANGDKYNAKEIITTRNNLAALLGESTREE